MIVQIDRDGVVRLLEPDEFRRFSIVLAESDAARDALAAIARRDGPDHAWIDPARVAALAGAVSPAWQQGFEAMIAYAASKGWTDGDGALRAHIERDQTSP